MLFLDFIFKKNPDNEAQIFKFPAFAKSHVWTEIEKELMEMSQFQFRLIVKIVSL